MRIAGFALLGVAAVATVIGLGTLATEGNTTAAPTSSASVTATTETSSSTPPVTTTTAPLTTTAAPVAPPPAPPPAPVRAPLRVYNNSTIPGLANRAAEDFRSAGWPVEEVGNYPGGIIPTSTVYFRPGSGEEVAARQLGSEFGLRVEPRFAGLGDASPGLIVIVTNDYQRR
ncbi:MAG: LytR C-terminal domain-containing protein [Pseudonocardiales bacterium]|nr:LytR C-terminal domain-containing protein [Pseudonocardiales bacterium]